MQLRIHLAGFVLAAAVSAAAAIGCAPAAVPLETGRVGTMSSAQEPGATIPEEGEPFALRVTSNVPASLTTGEDREVVVRIQNVGTATISLNLAADAVRVYASPTSRETPPPTDSEIIWSSVFVTQMPVVPAIGIGLTISPGEERDLDPLPLPVTIPPGAYSMRACVEVRTGAASTKTDICADPTNVLVK